jgi:23S rRNA pseudouridine1911/1915/1917 synthase
MEFSSFTDSGDDIRDEPDGDPELSWRRIGGPVSDLENGARFDGYLAKHFQFFSRSAWQKRIEDGLVLVNSRPLKCSSKLKSGDLIAMYSPPVAEPEVDRNIRVLWQDGPVMGIFKPGNLPMHENGPYRKNTFTEIVWQTLGREWSAVHRLDRETSGIVLCGATPEVRSSLARALARRDVKKQYLAICRGVPREEHWIADGPIGDLSASAIRIKKWVVPDGLPSQTAFSVEGQSQDAVLLRARPLTGRTNQIRIHSAHSGHVIYGDKLYHDDESIFLDYFEHGPTESVLERAGFRRLCLHATSLEFEHPDTRKQCLIECPMPDDMAEFWSDFSTNNQ